MQDFDALINNHDSLQAALEGSHITGGAAYAYWYDHRFPITKTVHRAGSILDVGCANSFLLRSLIAWCEHELVPYGIEPDEGLLEQCKTMFPEHKDHFSNLPLHKLNQAKDVGLPNKFDFVYWCVWDNFEFHNPQYAGWLDQAYAAVKPGGRLTLGFYDADMDVINNKIDWLEQHFHPILNRLDSDTNEEVFVWFDT